MRFEYDQSNPTNGIIRWIYDNRKEDYTNLLQVTATSHYYDHQTPDKAVDFNDQEYWIAKGDRAGEFINLYFPHSIIKITGYVLQTSHRNKGGDHPKIWSFAMSKDNITFFHNETYEDKEGSMNSPYRHIYLPYDHGIGCAFRIYPILSAYGLHNQMDVNQIELFGELFIDKEMMITKMFRIPNIIYTLLIFLF